MAEITVDIEVWCNCGNGLCDVTSVSYTRGGPQVIIEPCEECIEQARDEGYIEGFEVGGGDYAQTDAS